MSSPMLAVVAISLGAALGALARWRLGLWLNSVSLIPCGTLAANLIGGFLIGVAITWLDTLPELNPAWRLAIITGFLGGLTTFSTFSAEVVTFLLQQRYGLAVCTAVTHVTGSLALTVAGMRVAGYFLR